jgi:iron complex transport system ATP-binding protein
MAAVPMALALTNVTVMAGRVRLIEDVSFALRPGRLTVILGANGAGKSTALAVAAADLRPSRGEAMLDGVPLASHTPGALATRRAVVLQHTPINFALCVHEVVALSRTPFGTGVAGDDDVEERALRALELLPLAGRDYPTLSGGERQRVQIARALAQLWHAQAAGKPGYLLMDEPTAHLDLKHQVIALEAARDFVDAGGAALCILHDIGLAREFSDEVLLMKQGRLVAQGEAGSLLTAPMIAEIYGISDRRAQQFAAS